MTQLSVQQLHFPETGRFGDFGGRYVPETLIPALEQLTAAYQEERLNPLFWEQLNDLRTNYAGRPTPVTFAQRLSQELGYALYLKREDLNHTGSHKLNNCLGQVLLAQKMGKKRIIAETGAGQHGVATATVCALFGLECVVYMGEKDTQRQALNVFRMELLGAEVRPVTSGTKTLKDATNEAMRDWVANVADTHYIIGSVVGPHPYPSMVRDFQSVISAEARTQLQPDPDYVVACVGGGSNAAGIFAHYVPTTSKLIGVEAGGLSSEPGQHCASISRGQPGVLHGSRTFLLQDEDGQVAHTTSISAGLDYPGVGPEHSFWGDSDRIQYHSVTDQQALTAFQKLSSTEGIIPALESAHALAWCLENQQQLQGSSVLLCLSGRGDKDVAQVQQMLEKNSPS